ncbi:MAG: beta-galactosidase [Clostridia bacterium]|nr:beta-galactosidase [Clostridia bacterium]
MSYTHFVPRPEHPNPQFFRESWLNLNGEWEFYRDHSVSGKARKLYDASSLPERITVPFCMESELSGIGDKDFCDCVWYRRKLDIPSDWLTDGKRVLLHVGACDYRTDIYVNGTHVGLPHRGGYTSFSYDITAPLRTGTNVLVICAEDRTRSGEQPCGKQSRKYSSYGCYYTRTTGIWQTVWLESVAPAHIESFHLIPNMENASLSIFAKVKEGAGKIMTATAYWNGKKVGEASSRAAETSCNLILPLSELHPWEIGKGGLYDLILTLGDDQVKSYFGMRTLSLDDSALVINGKKIFQRLVLDQGFYPDGIYTAPSEQELINDITRSMACGFNGARLHQKVFEPLFLYHCDRLGYLVWGEHGNWGLRVSQPSAWKGFLSEWIKIVERDRNHPALIGWCPFNETEAGQDDDLIAYTAQLTRMLDPTRPVIDNSGWIHVEGASDIEDWHDYDQNPDTFRQRYIDVANGTPILTKPLTPYPLFPRFISEYGGIGWNVNLNQTNAWGYGNNPKTEKEFLERFRGLTEALLFNPYITGLCYTQLTDVEQETNGLYTYDRQAKFDPKFFCLILEQKAAIEDQTE